MKQLMRSRPPRRRVVRSTSTHLKAATWSFGSGPPGEPRAEQKPLRSQRYTISTATPSHSSVLPAAMTCRRLPSSSTRSMSGLLNMPSTTMDRCGPASQSRHSRHLFSLTTTERHLHTLGHWALTDSVRLSTTSYHERPGGDRSDGKTTNRAARSSCAGIPLGGW